MKKIKKATTANKTIIKMMNDIISSAEFSFKMIPIPRVTRGYTIVKNMF